MKRILLLVTVAVLMAAMTAASAAAAFAQDAPPPQADRGLATGGAHFATSPGVVIFIERHDSIICGDQAEMYDFPLVEEECDDLSPDE